MPVNTESPTTEQRSSLRREYHFDGIVDLVREYGAHCRTEGKLGHVTPAAALALNEVRAALRTAFEELGHSRRLISPNDQTLF